MGENSGVCGVDGMVDPGAVAARIPSSKGCSGKGGNASQVDVIRMDFSTARRYLPTQL